MRIRRLFAPMNSTPGHVCQPTSRADTLPDLYSALSVTVSTFSIEQFTITRVHEYVPSRATIKVPPRKAPVYPALQTTHKHSHLFQPPLSSIFMGSNQNDVLSWTSQDPRQSQLFSPWGVVYRFQVCIIDIAYAPMALIHLSPDRDQRAGPEHHHCLACDTCKQRGSGGQAGVGPRWWSKDAPSSERSALRFEEFPI